jgi:hypothetical protein
MALKKNQNRAFVEIEMKPGAAEIAQQRWQSRIIGCLNYGVGLSGQPPLLINDSDLAITTESLFEMLSTYWQYFSMHPVDGAE